MPKSDYLAQGNAQFAAQQLTFMNGIGSYSAVLGLTPGEMELQGDLSGRRQPGRPEESGDRDQRRRLKSPNLNPIAGLLPPRGPAKLFSSPFPLDASAG